MSVILKETGAEEIALRKFDTGKMFGFQREKKMDFANYKMEWPREGLTVRCFAHDIMNYRYHWHPDEYELNILLHGSQEYCRGTQNVLLEEDDVLLTPPGVGHASFGQQAKRRRSFCIFQQRRSAPSLKRAACTTSPPAFRMREHAQKKGIVRSGSMPARSLL